MDNKYDISDVSKKDPVLESLAKLAEMEIPFEALINETEEAKAKEERRKEAEAKVAEAVAKEKAAAEEIKSNNRIRKRKQPKSPNITSKERQRKQDKQKEQLEKKREEKLLRKNQIEFQNEASSYRWLVGIGIFWFIIFLVMMYVVIDSLFYKRNK